MNDSSILEINLLGPVEITANGRPLTIKRKIERALLYILAGKHTAISRTALIDMIWPDDDTLDTRAALRTALSRLRKALPDSEFLITDMDQVSLDFHRSRVDLHLFSNNYKSLKNLLSIYQENRPLPSQIREQIKNAIDLWHGDNFIMGDDLTNYPEVEYWRKFNERLLVHQRQFLERRLAAHYYAAGQLDAALHLYVGLSRAELADVSLHLTVIDILTKLGRLQTTIDYCDNLERRYERAYNAPLPDALLKRCEYAKILFDTSQARSRQDWPIPHTMKLHFVGRQSELNLLKQKFFQGGLVEIKGQMGCGKTRLVQELYQTLMPMPKLLYAPAHERENTLPLEPIVHCLRRHITDDFWEELEPIWVNQLSILMPELSANSHVETPFAIDKLPTGKQRLFDALMHAFLLVNKKYGRVLFFLDDAQWADRQTLQVLDYLYNHNYFDLHGLLIIASRSEESNVALDDMVDNLHKTRHVEILPLNGLTPSELNDLAQQALNRSLSPGFIDKLYRETNGNPFIALEIIHNLLQTVTDLEQLGTDTSLPLPQNVHALIRRRINHLDETSQHLLRSAAVLGDDFSFDLLQAITDHNEFPNADIFDPLIQAGFIHQTENPNPQDDNLHFVHQKMREVTLKETSPTQLKILHRRAAQVLAERPQAFTHAAIIAGHYLAGGDVINAFQWYLKAANHAWALGAQEDTNHAYQKAESLLKNAPAHVFDRYDVIDLYQPWSRFAYEAYNYAMAEETAIKLLNIGEKEGDPLLIGLAHIALSEACFLRFEFDVSLSLLDKALENLKQTDYQIGIILVYIRRAVLYWWKLRFKESRQAARQALTQINSFEEFTPQLQQLSLNADHVIGVTYFAQGEAKKCLAYANAIKQKYTQNLGPTEKIRIFYIQGYAHLISANYEQSIQHFTTAHNLASGLNRMLIIEISLYKLAQVELKMGKIDIAFEHASKALELGEKFNHVHASVSAYLVLGNIFSNLGNYEHALYYNRVAQVREGFSSDSLYGIEIQIHLAHILAFSDRVLEARSMLNDVKEVTQKLGLWQHFVQSLLIENQCNVLSGTLDNSGKKLSSAIQIAQEKGLRYELLWCQLSQAQVYLLKGHHESAILTIKKIILESQSLKTPFMTIGALRLAAHLRRSNANLVQDINIQAVFDDLMSQLEANAQSEPLRKEFQKAKALWRKEIEFP